MVGSFIALSPPNPSKGSVPEDSLSFLAKGYTTVLYLAPFGVVTLHTCSLAYFYPIIPSIIHRHGEENHLNSDLISWSAATFIPLALILCVGIPLRLVSYASLGKNFTFDLAVPDRLVTDGIHHYLQHPSYTGTLVLIFSLTMLLLRIDGALSCWIPPHWYGAVRNLWCWFVVPLWFSYVVLVTRTRVIQEESMMLATFGSKWERWHATTARFIPGIF